MSWTWIEEALDENADHADESTDADDSLSLEELPPPDPAREGIDWVRDEDGEIAHPIKKRATEMLYSLLDELRAAGNPEQQHAGLADFVGHTMVLSGKLAGALGSLARGWDSEPGLTIASLKRALEILHQALTAAGALGPETPFPPERIPYFRDELFSIREEMIALMATLRAR